ncbi:hypothetical protein GQ457_03G033660 [Hibiscus cannabinus]
MVNATSSGNQSLDLQGIASGRPPEGVPELGVLPILERSASPLASEEQQLAKKSRGIGSTVDTGGDPNTANSMDTDSMHSAGLGEFRNEKSNLHGKETYAAMAAKGRSGNGMPAIVNDANPDEVFVLDEDCTVDDSGKYPTIRFSDRVHDRVDWSMRHTIIVRLLGRAIGYKVLLDRIYGLWHPRGELQLIDLENNYYLVRFEDERDYVDVLVNGPWTIFGNYLTVQPWSRSFSTDEKHPTSIVVWVRLPGLPYRYYCKALFRRIAQLVGKVIKVDYNTKAGERGKFARLAISVDLNKPLRSCIGIDNFVQKIEYEGLHRICYSCGIYGHDAESCGKSSPPKEDPLPAMPGQNLNHTIEGSNTSLYGPWMLASTRRRGTVKVANAGNPSVSNHTHTRGSRFIALNVEENADVDNGVADIGAGAVVTAGEVTVQEQANRGASIAAAVQRQDLMNNAAYLASNPTRKSKKGAVSKDIFGELNVVPVSSDHAASVVPHNVQRGSSSHNAILIVEPGFEANTGSPSRTGKGRGKGVKGPGEIQRKGFKVHRQNEAKTVGNRVPTLWAKEFADQIDVLTANEQDPPDISVNRERLVTDMDYSSGDGDDLIESSLDKAKDGTVVTPQGC